MAASGGEALTRRITTITIVLFWISQYSILTVSRMIYHGADSANMLVPRLVVTLAGVVLSFGIAALHRRTRGASLIRRLVLAVLLALAGAVAHTIINFAIFHIFRAEENWQSAMLVSYAMAALQWFWGYAALSGLLLAVTYSAELHDQERRAAQLQREAHAAHLRALRYQLNPHFMFNTLNSIASLVAAHEVGIAERMVENLSDFLRAGLAIDPGEDIPLGREIELQSLYLSIETVRFPNRLVVEIDVPVDVRDVLVPSLITQPLIENAVRHAVASSTVPVTLTIAARSTGDRLAISIHNTGGDGAEHRRSAGTGVGIANVAERLSAHYGDDCDFHATRGDDGSFTVRFAVPMREAR